MRRPLTTVWIGHALVSEILSQAGRDSERETGGVLMGYSGPGMDGADNVVITHIVGPGPRAEHERTSFVPDYDWQNCEIAGIYEKSGRRASYLGDWHTHPRAAPIPSERDLSTLRRIALHKEARCPQPLMAIVGADDVGDPTIRVVRYEPHARWRGAGPRAAAVALKTF